MHTAAIALWVPSFGTMLPSDATAAPGEWSCKVETPSSASPVITPQIQSALEILLPLFALIMNLCGIPQLGDATADKMAFSSAGRASTVMNQDFLQVLHQPTAQQHPAAGADSLQ
jgi:hypothetical protein